ncbi:MAG TPA: hypothetical protein VGO93_09480 [Candidatus Xenobia bacterium]|jgi:hypothetical protein
MRPVKIVPTVVGQAAKPYLDLFLTALFELKGFLLEQFGPSLRLDIMPTEYIDAPTQE